MPVEKGRNKNSRGLISDTLEMPALNPNEIEERHSRAARQVRQRRHRRTLLIVTIAVLGSFVLGFSVRMALHIAPELNIFSVENTTDTEVAPQNIIAPGQDISAQLGEVINVAMRVGQVMPFNVSSGSIKYTVLGGYLLSSNNAEDRTKPVMAVVPVRILEQTVAENDVVRVTGKVAMVNENAEVAQLTEEQEKDLNYIVERVNFWDRVTLFAERVQLGEE